MRRLLPLSVAATVLGWSLACAGLDTAEPDGELLTALDRGCYDRPKRAFTTDNHAEVEAFARVGDPAWDVTLPTLDGGEVHLAELLDSKPVVVVTGSYTCPVYRRNGRTIDELAQRLGDLVHVVVVYGPEAHPKTDPSPYRGKAWPLKHSDHDLASTFEERVANAKKVGRGPGVIEAVEPLDNPFWCTYGTAPNAAFLIGTDGTFHAVHDWFDAPTLIGSIEALTGVKVGERKAGRDQKRRKRRRGR